MFSHPAGFLVTWAHYNIGKRVVFLTILKIIFRWWLPASKPWWLSRAHRIKSKLLLAAPVSLPPPCRSLTPVTVPWHSLSVPAPSIPSRGLWMSCYFCPSTCFPNYPQFPLPHHSGLSSQPTSLGDVIWPLELHVSPICPPLLLPQPVSRTSPFLCIELSHFWYDLDHLFAYLNIVYLPVNFRRPKDC